VGKQSKAKQHRRNVRQAAELVLAHGVKDGTTIRVDAETMKRVDRLLGVRK